ncbi:MAG: FG-GAP-like repeat-containing protein [Actinomycetota bacterium]|nr:FG-GAP-like repeat-containing protein [Actinomycetota bacterium]
MKVKTYHSRVLIAWLAGAVLAVGLMALVGTKPAWTASRTFEPALNSPIAVGSAPTTVTNADFNGDGKTDLAAQNSGSNNVSVRLGNGDGTFQAKQDFAVGLTPTSVISADFDSDGIADLAVTNQDSNNVSVLLGQDLDSDGKGDGTFKQKQDFAVGSQPSSAVSADFNGDTYADLAVANSTSNTVSVLLGQDSNGDNKADGTFRAKQDFSIATRTCVDFLCAWDTAAPNQVISADFNGDNKADLATANLGSSIFNATGPGGVSVLLGKGDGTFQTYKLVKTNAANSSVPSIAAVDFNASGPLDLVATEYNSSVVSLLRGNGDGTFQTEQNLPVGSNPSAVTSADLDGDTKADDLAVSNSGSNNVSVLFNNDNGSFQAAQNFSAGSGPYFVIGANFNTDSFTDLAVANYSSNNVSVLLNTPRPDTTAPITTRSLSPQPNAAGWNKEDVTVTLNATDDDSGVKEISYSINGGQYTTVQQSSVQIPVTSEGETTISYYATDNASNVEAQQTFTVKLDKSAPSAPVISSPANNSFDTDGTITVAGTAEANSTVEVFEATASGDTSKGTTPVDAGGTWIKTLSGVSDGSHTYKAKAKDAAGNTSDFSNSRTVIVDTGKPQVSSTTPLAGATNVALGANLTATFSEKMRTSSINTSTFKLYRIKSDGTQTQVTDVVVSLSSDGLKATLNPFGAKTTLLARNTKYKGVVTTGARDLAGNALAQQKSWTFKTRS